MSDIKISLKDQIKTKRAEIDGHIFTVRQMGAGEQMDLLALGRKLQGLSSGEDLSQIEQIENIRREMLKIYEGLFEDGQNGKQTKKLIRALNDQQIQDLINTIFSS